MTIRTNRIEEIFQDARELQADALEMLALGRIRNAAEKAWGQPSGLRSPWCWPGPARSTSGLMERAQHSAGWRPWTKPCGAADPGDCRLHRGRRAHGRNGSIQQGCLTAPFQDQAFPGNRSSLTAGAGRRHPFPVTLRSMRIIQADGGGEEVAAVRRRRSGGQPGRAPEGAAGVVLMDSLILTSGRLFVARVVQDLKPQTVSVWQPGGM